MTLRRDDVFRHELAGAGGWGDPLERAPERVLRDVRNELVSVEAARKEYGVVIDPRCWAVDEAETRQSRAQMRAARPPGELPWVLWEDWPKLSEAAE